MMIQMINLSQYKKITFLTGAGASAHLGIPTFEEIYSNNEYMESMRVDVLKSNPEKVWKVLGSIRPSIFAVDGIAHKFGIFYDCFLSGLPFGSWSTITTNIDGVKPFVTGPKLIQLHGDGRDTKCINEKCDYKIYYDHNTYEGEAPTCPKCGGYLRPDVVLFGEMLPYETEHEAKKAMRDCDLLVVIGCSDRTGTVSKYLRSAKYEGATTILINKTPLNGYAFDHQFIGDAFEMIYKHLAF
jgi:NAD-dependent deacetylase